VNPERSELLCLDLGKAERLRRDRLALGQAAERAENLVSHHVRVLRALGLAERRREGKMVLYRLTNHGHALLQPLLAGEDVTRA